MKKGLVKGVLILFAICCWAGKFDVHATELSCHEADYAEDNTKVIVGLKDNYIYDYCETTHQLELNDDFSSELKIADFVWNSDNENVATVDSEGLVKVGYKKGTAIITGAYIDADGKEYNIECSVTVKPYAISYSLDDNTAVGSLLQEYYPGDLDNCNLNKNAYKEGCNLREWCLDEQLSRTAYASTLYNMRGDINLFPKWGNKSLKIFYYGVDESGEYDIFSTYLMGSLDITKMPCLLPRPDELDPNPNDMIKAFSQANGSEYIFSYWSWDSEGQYPVSEIDHSAYNMRYDEYTQTYIQDNYVYLYPQFSKKDTTCVIKETSMSLNGKIGINIFMYIPDEIASDQEAYVLIGDSRYAIGEAQKEIDESEKTLYRFTDMKAIKEIADYSEVSVCSANGKYVPLADASGKLFRNCKMSIRIRDICEIIVEVPQEDQSDDAEIQRAFNKLKNALRNYNDYARRLFNYKNDNLSPDIMTSLEELSLEGYEKSISGVLPKGIEYYGTSLILADSTTIRHYFVVNELDNMDQYNFVIVDKDKKIPVKANLTGNVCYIDITNIPAYDMDQKYKLALYDNQSMWTIDYCVLSYVNAFLDKNKDNRNLADLLSSMYAYWEAAKDYFNLRKIS